MNAKDYLKQYRAAISRVNAAQDHLTELRAMAERITPNYSGGGGTHPTGDRLGAAVARLVDAESRVSDELELLEATERDVISTIGKITDGTLHTLLYERYINGKTWEQIAVVMNYSYQHIVHYLHPKALNAVKHLIESNIRPML